MSAQSSEFPIRKKRAEGGRKALSRLWGKIGGEKEDVDQTAVGTTTMTQSSLDSFYSSGSPAPSSDDSPPSAGPERSWFARFFHLKPSTKILCFSIPRGRARQELVILLREWQRHGIRDLRYSRETNTITARVDKQNALDIKPVSSYFKVFIYSQPGGLADLLYVAGKDKPHTQLNCMISDSPSPFDRKKLSQYKSEFKFNLI